MGIWGKLPFFVCTLRCDTHQIHYICQITCSPMWHFILHTRPGLVRNVHAGTHRRFKCWFCIWFECAPPYDTTYAYGSDTGNDNEVVPHGYAWVRVLVRVCVYVRTFAMYILRILFFNKYIRTHLIMKTNIFVKTCLKGNPKWADNRLVIIYNVKLYDSQYAQQFGTFFLCEFF